MTPDDPPLQELDLLLDALARNAAAIEAVRERAQQVRSRRTAGEPWSDIVRSEPRPLIVELLSDNLGRISAAGGRFRRAEARALHAEGMTMDRIAELFGVSRQRISALLRPDDEA